MPPLRYHPGQTAIQEEAHTTAIADKLAHWVGPIAEFASAADLILLATSDRDGPLRFVVVSGPAPLVEVSTSPALRVRLPREAASGLPLPATCGGLAIRLDQARRVRLNGRLASSNGRLELEPEETFTLCRKYMAPSVSLAKEILVGPASREAVPLEDAALAALLARAETSFLASVSPTGMPDVAHRGGPAGFLEWDAQRRKLTWTEYVGDGVFKSAGNVRATKRVTLLVPDPVSGDGFELVGRAAYTNQRSDRRVAPLVQHSDAFPTQGTMVCQIEAAFRLRRIWHPRQRIAKTIRITSRSTPHEQAPQ